MGRGRLPNSAESYWLPGQALLGAYDALVAAAVAKLKHHGLSAVMPLVHSSLGISAQDATDFRKGSVRENAPSSDKIAGKILNALARPLSPPRGSADEYPPAYMEWWEGEGLPLRRELFARFPDRLERPAFSTSIIASKDVAPTDQPQATNSHPPTPDQRSRDGDMLAQLASFRADWQATNVPEGEGQWLLLDVNFGFDMAHDRGEDSDYEVYPHRLRLSVDLDGGAASPRERWTQASEQGPQKIEFIPDGSWRDETPRFTIDNPESKAPLGGRFPFFPLICTHRTAGPGARLVASVDRSGIRIKLPETILERLESDGHVMTEGRILMQWILLRDLPKASHHAGGYLIADLPLRPGRAA